MANNKYIMTISMDFGNFITEIFAKHFERFSKKLKFGKLAILHAILLHDLEGYGRTIMRHYYKHGQMNKFTL